jgi:hypothetical protein
MLAAAAGVINSLNLLFLNQLQMSCDGARQQLGYQMPIKVKGHYFNYLVDLHSKTANFPNPLLFDRTAGIRRF